MRGTLSLVGAVMAAAAVLAAWAIGRRRSASVDQLSAAIGLAWAGSVLGFAVFVVTLATASP
ncbi:MAG: hypothetical protein ACLGIO_14235 [Acidimicrobiia bacterium]